MFIPAMTESQRVINDLRSSFTRVTLIKSSMSYTDPCFMDVAKCWWNINRTCLPFAGTPLLAWTSLKVSIWRARSPSAMLVKPDSNLASRVTKVPLSFKSLTVFPSTQTLPIQANASSGLGEAALTASLTLILQFRYCSGLGNLGMWIFSASLALLVPTTAGAHC